MSDPIGFVARHKTSGLVVRDFALPGEQHQLADGFEWMPVSNWRPDGEATAAAPALKGKHAVVVYFETDADLQEFVEAITAVKPGMRTVKL